jgi:cobalt/nickel transport system permease protein
MDRAHSLAGGAGSERQLIAMQSAGFVERSLAAFAEVLELADTAERTALRRGLLQPLDPRTKIAGALLFVGAAVAAHHAAVPLALGGVAVALAALSRIPLRLLAARIWVPVLFFTGVIAVPAIFTTPGVPRFHLPLLDWAATEQGLRTAALLLVRAETCATVVVLVVLSTPWARLLKALRMLGVPAMAVAILGMTHRYVFLLLGLSREAFEARRARVVGPLDGPEQRRLAAASAGALLGKSLQVADDVHSAMQARGFRGAALTLDPFAMRQRDWWALAGFAGLAAAALFLDHQL